MREIAGVNRERDPGVNRVFLYCSWTPAVVPSRRGPVPVDPASEKERLEPVLLVPKRGQS